MNYATKSAKDEAAYESAPAAQSPMMMSRTGMSAQDQVERESLDGAGDMNMAGQSLKTFSTEERTQKSLKMPICPYM